ncbi:hypothetical protein GCM10010430_73280 [Kitasatospora cystarginea]|uniref:Peptidase S26 domain-containing protein n=2 Tax=Streptomycetaceae TaxID=2062 RepID=A0ABN3EY90_9ACTN
MAPQYFPGDRVLAARGWFVGRPRTGDVVVVRRPSGMADPGHGNAKLLIKNVAAAPGDPEPEIFTAATGNPVGTPTPDGCYLVLGRHVASEDSKRWGYVKRRDIVGRVLQRHPRRNAPGPGDPSVFREQPRTLQWKE